MKKRKIDNLYINQHKKFTQELQDEARMTMFCSLEKTRKQVVKFVQVTQSQENIKKYKLLMIPSVVSI